MREHPKFQNQFEFNMTFSGSFLDAFLLVANPSQLKNLSELQNQFDLVEKNILQSEGILPKKRVRPATLCLRAARPWPEECVRPNFGTPLQSLSSVCPTVSGCSGERLRRMKGNEEEEEEILNPGKAQSGAEQMCPSTLPIYSQERLSTGSNNSPNPKSIDTCSSPYSTLQ